MKKVKITVMRKACYEDLISKYENFCESAWSTISPFVLALSCGGEDIYDGWMKNKKSAMISCNDGFRPVSFLIEAIDK